MKKIIVDKSEGIAEVIDRVLAATDTDITLVIPKGSALAKSASSFRLLKREAGLAEKTIVVESSDETVIDLATAHGIAIAGAGMGAAAGAGTTAGAKPIHNAGGVSDIVLKRRDDDGDEGDARPARHGKKEAGVKLTIRAESTDDKDEVEDEADEQQEQKSFLSADRFFKPRVIPVSRHDDEDEDDDDGGLHGISNKTIAWIIGVIVVLGVIFYGVTAIFGRAQVTIDFTQTPWSYQANFIADKNATAISPSAAGAAAAAMATGVTTIPAQVFTTQKNITQLFPATGASAQVSTKAQGTITIYNDYGSASQDLVATTRFLTPDGKLFRLVNDVTVPGAQVASSGAITPSSITAPIIADQGGPAYNVGPVAKLTIPGFQNNPGRYAGFYGAITGVTTGGFTGTKMVPTAADIAAAKASTTAILQADLQDGLTASYPNNFKILDGATDITITKLTVNTSTDANGNFSVFGEASLTAIGFDQSALENYLLSVAQNQVATLGGSAGVAGGAAVGAGGGTTMAFKNFANPNYSDVQASFSKGQVNFTLSVQENLEPAFSSADFASSIVGKSIGTARDSIQNLPQLSNGTISVWPIWLWSMPSNANKISVTVN